MIKCETRNVGSVTIFSVVGNMGQSFLNEIHEEIQTELSSSSTENFLMDLTEVSNINSVGIGLIVSTYKSILSRKGRYALISSNTEVNNTLKMIGVTRLFKVYNNEEEAITEFTS